MIIVITGPTCTSKSKIAVEVAKAFNAEIVNADAFQIYKELDIGTAKPDASDLKIVEHHLYNIKKPTDRYSIYDYQKDARKCIDSILKQGKNVVLVGGSGLYIRSALYDYNFKEPEHPVDLSNFYDLTDEELHDRLKEIDPKEADKIHPHNRKRVLRAIYIYLAYNKTKTELESMQEHKIIYDDVYIYAIDMDKKVLYERINKRVEAMIKKGLVKEAISLSKKYGNDIQAFNAIGYKEIINNPNLDTNEITELIQKNTRNYAKRQKTFIRYQYQNLVKYVTCGEDIIYDINNNNMDAKTRGLLGDKAWEVTKKLKIIVFGTGGVGGTAIEALARCGITKLSIVDNDVVNCSNLNRQILYVNNDVGTPKVDVAKKRIEAINPRAKVTTFDKFVDEDNLKSFSLDKYDYVIDAIDSFKSKKALIEYCLKKDIPFISSLGMGNRFDSTKLEITTLDKTHDDPLARKLRSELTKDKIDLRKIHVVASNEVPLKHNEVITSIIFVPSHAGLLLASHVLKECLNKEINKDVKED